jgi:hypothetical protein
MYPAQALVDGLYTVDDLPDEVQIGPYILQKGVAQAVFPVQVEGAFYGTISDGDEEAYIYLDNFAWNFGPAVGSGGQECLVDGNIVQDQFADSYTVTGPPGGPVTVTRQGLCLWTGSDTCGNGVILEFISDNDDDEKVWFIGWVNYFELCITLDSSSGTKRAYAQGGDGIDTPVGNYYENVGRPPIGSVS